MLKKFWFLFFIFLISSAFSCTVIDDTGTAVQLNKSATRIISLAPDITEILFAIGAEKNIVGVIDGSDYPAAAQKIKRVGSYHGLDLESIVALHPDLIVTWQDAFSRQMLALKQLGIPVYITHPQRLEDIPRTMQHLGCLVQKEKLANRVAQTFLQEINRLRKQNARKKPVTVFYQIGSYSLMTVNRNHWINQVISLCGGKNIFADSKLLIPEVGFEAVIAANPQVIISDATDGNWQIRWQQWQTISAVKNHLLFAVNPDWIDRAGPRLILGAKEICAYIDESRHIEQTKTRPLASLPL